MVMKHKKCCYTHHIEPFKKIIMQLKDKDLQRLLDLIDREELSIIFKALDLDAREKILHNLSKTKGQFLKEDTFNYYERRDDIIPAIKAAVSFLRHLIEVHTIKRTEYPEGFGREAAL